MAHAKEICAGGNADIAYGNQEADGENEVFFMLYLKKARNAEAEDKSGLEGERKNRPEVAGAEIRCEVAGGQASATEGYCKEPFDSKKRWFVHSLGIIGSICAVLVLIVVVRTLLLGKGKFSEDIAGGYASTKEYGNVNGRDMAAGSGSIIAETGDTLAGSGSMIAGSGDAAAGSGNAADYSTTENSGMGAEGADVAEEEPESVHVQEAATYAELETAWKAASDLDSLEEFHPYLLYDEEHKPAGAEESLLVALPETMSWNGEATKLATVAYEIYDAQGMRIGRDTYVSYDMDTSKDKGQMVKRDQRLDFSEGEYYRRMQERWEYDAGGREVSYRKYKQYGEKLQPELVLLELYSYDEGGSRICAMEGNGDGDTIHVCDRNTRRQTVREYEVDHNDNILRLVDYSYGKSGYPLMDAEGSWVWNSSRSRAHVTDTDYYGNQFECVYTYDAAGHRTDGYYLWDGAYYRGYEASYDADGRLVEEYDNMPALLKELPPSEFRDTF